MTSVININQIMIYEETKQSNQLTAFNPWDDNTADQARHGDVDDLSSQDDDSDDVQQVFYLDSDEDDCRDIHYHSEDDNDQYMGDDAEEIEYYEHETTDDSVNSQDEGGESKGKDVSYCSVCFDEYLDGELQSCDEHSVCSSCLKSHILLKGKPEYHKQRVDERTFMKHFSGSETCHSVDQDFLKDEEMKQECSDSTNWRCSCGHWNNGSSSPFMIPSTCSKCRQTTICRVCCAKFDTLQDCKNHIQHDHCLELTDLNLAERNDFRHHQHKYAKGSNLQSLLDPLCKCGNRMAKCPMDKVTITCLDCGTYHCKLCQSFDSEIRAKQHYFQSHGRFNAQFLKDQLIVRKVRMIQVYTMYENLGNLDEHKELFQYYGIWDYLIGKKMCPQILEKPEPLSLHHPLMHSMTRMQPMIQKSSDDDEHGNTDDEYDTDDDHMRGKMTESEMTESEMTESEMTESEITESKTSEDECRESPYIQINRYNAHY